MTVLSHADGRRAAARCGCVTGKGLASLIRERFGVRKSVLAMAALLIANTAVTISEFAGIAQRPCSLWRAGEHLGAVGGAAGVDAYHVG